MRENERDGEGCTVHVSGPEICRMSWKGKLWILIRVSVLSIVETMKDLVRERSL